MLVTSNYLNCSRRNPKRSAQCVYHNGILVYSTAHAGISCIKTGANQKFISKTMDLRSVPEYVIKKGRPHGHRHGKKLGDKIFSANQLKNKCRKREISKESTTDSHEIQKIENHRDEDHCRRWDALADEEHTHHLTV